jgi:hypothetical protein
LIAASCPELKWITWELYGSHPRFFNATIKK